MIYGIGIDTVETEDLADITEKKMSSHFFGDVFTRKEAEVIMKSPRPAYIAAGNFAVKEAVAKALHTGFFLDFWPADIEVTRDTDGSPHVSLSERAKAMFGEKGISERNIFVSITDTSSLVSAVAVIEYIPEEHR